MIEITPNDISKMIDDVKFYFKKGKVILVINKKTTKIMEIVEVIDLEKIKSSLKYEIELKSLIDTKNEEYYTGNYKKKGTIIFSVFPNWDFQKYEYYFLDKEEVKNYVMLSEVEK